MRALLSIISDMSSRIYDSHIYHVIKELDRERKIKDIVRVNTIDKVVRIKRSRFMGAYNVCVSEYRFYQRPLFVLKSIQ